MTHIVKKEYLPVKAKVKRPPHHVNGDTHHHSVHFESWINLPEMNAYIDPHEPGKVLVPAMWAIMEFMKIPGMGSTYWTMVDDHHRSRRGPYGTHLAYEEYLGFFELPCDCCEVIMQPQLAA